MRADESIARRIARRVTTIVKSRTAKVVLVVVCGLFALGYYAVNYTWLGIFTIVFYQNPGPFDRERFENVIEEVRNSGIKPGETRVFRLDDLAHPESLRPWKPDEQLSLGQGLGNVWAQMTAEGKLKVVIQTRDLGHAGRYGFAYSEAPLSPQPYDSDWFYLDLPCDLNLTLPGMQIDSKWWKVLNNLG